MKSTWAFLHLWERERRQASITSKRGYGKKSKVGKESYFHKQEGKF